MWVYCLGVCLPKLPGLVEAIVLTPRHNCSHETISLSQYLPYNMHHNKRINIKKDIKSPNSCCYAIYQNTDRLALWYYVTAITHHDVTQAQKQSFKQLRTVPERWPDQTHCDLCAHVFPLCFAYIMTIASLPHNWVFWGATQRPVSDCVLIHRPTRFMWGDREEFTSNESLFF